MYRHNVRLIRTVAIFILFSILFPLSLSSLTVEKGRIRLTLHEDNGKFSLSYLEDLKKERYASLFFERDPRTSSIGMLIDNKIITLGPTSRFEQTVEKTVDGARFIWISSSLRVTQSFSFIKSKPNGLVDGVVMEIHVRNDSNSSSNIGVHLLIDTHLGEKQKAHFTTASGEKIRSESGFTSIMPLYWISPTESESYKGLQGMVKGEGLTKPDKLIFANWKRLNDKLWNFEVKSGRNFNLPPYSINDSAVCYFFGPKQLSSGSSLRAKTALGAARGSTFTIAGEPGKSSSEKSDEEKSSASSAETSLENLRAGLSGTSSGEEMSIEERLIMVNDIISDIDSLLSNPEEISEEKIELIEQSISNIDQSNSSD